MSVNGHAAVDPVMQLQHNGQQEGGGLKAKINAIRQRFPFLSKKDCSLILHSFDNSMEASVNCIVEGNHKDVLNDWNTQSRKSKSWNPSRRKKGEIRDEKLFCNEKQDSNTVVNGIPDNNTDYSESSLKASMDSPATSDSGILITGSCSSSRKSSVSLAGQENTIENAMEPSRCSTVETPLTTRTADDKSNRRENAIDLNNNNAHIPLKSRPPKDLLIRSVKDLNRTAVSLARFHLVLEEELESSEKMIKSVFAELFACLHARQDQLLCELGTCKKQSVDTLDGRQQDAAGLKYRCARAPSMTDDEVLSLRSEIKSFVGDRKIDETVAKTTRFTCAKDQATMLIKDFGRVAPLVAPYSGSSSSQENGNAKTEFSQSFLDKITPPSSNPCAVSSTANDVGIVDREGITQARPRKTTLSQDELDKQVAKCERIQASLLSQEQSMKKDEQRNGSASRGGWKAKRDHNRRANQRNHHSQRNEGGSVEHPTAESRNNGPVDARAPPKKHNKPARQKARHFNRQNDRTKDDTTGDGSLTKQPLPTNQNNQRHADRRNAPRLPRKQRAPKHSSGLGSKQPAEPCADAEATANKS